MTEEIAGLFKSETILDLPVWKEVCNAFQMTTPKALFFRILCILLLSYCTIAVLITPSMSLSVLTGAVIGCLIGLIRRRSDRNGGKQYQELLASCGGNPPHNKYNFSSEGIDSHSVHKDTDTHWDYTQVTDIIDGGRILLIILDTNQFTVIDPRWLTGGSREELVSFLREKCINARKGIRKTTFGMIVSVVYRIVAVLLLAVTLFFAAKQVLPAPTSGTLSNNLSVREVAAVLEEMDIRCSEEIIAEAEQWESESEQYHISATTEDRILSLLCNSGYGSYDWDTWEWTPPDSGVYWLDMEAFDIGSMYTQYLTGLAAISEDALIITDIEENHDGINWETGTGSIHLSFTLNGTRHSITATLDSDWYDVSALDKINKIANDCGEHQIYIASDSGQGILVFYRSREWAAEFTSLTGIPLSDKISSLWYGLPF